MLKSSLLEILRTFSKQELIKFEDFVRSPYFNKKENVLKLFVEIKKFAPAFSEANLEKEKIWVNVFPEKDYNYGIMKNLIHELTKLSESFITLEHANHDKMRNNTDLLETLLQRQITRVFSSKIDMMEKIYDNPDLKNENYNIAEYYEYLNKLYYLKSIYNRHYNIGSTAAYEFTCQSLDYLIYSTIINFYKRYNNFLAHKHSKIPGKGNAAKIFLTGLNENLILPLLNDVKDKSKRDYLILKCFHEMNIALDPADINSYYNFKKSLKDCLDIFPKQDLKDLITCLANSLRGIKNSRSGLEINFDKEIIENGDLKIENNIFLEPNGMMDGNEYLIYIISAFSLKKYEKIEILTQKFGNKIPGYRRDNDNNYAQALICYGKKEYSKSLEHLSRINYNFFNMKHHVKYIQMMNYYELADDVTFSYVADSYRHFLSKNKSVVSFDKSARIDFCNNMNKLFKLRETFDKFELEKFRMEIKEKRTIYRDWILDKIAEIEKNS